MSCTNQVVRFALSDANGVFGFSTMTTNIEAGSTGLAAAGSTQVGYVCADYSGNYYVTDPAQHCIFKIAEGRGENQSTVTKRSISVLAGLPGTSGNNNILTGSVSKVTCANARFDTPLGICCDKSNNIFVCDSGNNQIRKIDQGGYVSIVAGDSTAGTAGFVDTGAWVTPGGAKTASQFNTPTGICADSAGTLYVVEAENHSLRKIMPNGDVLTISGLITASGTGDEENCKADKYSKQLNDPKDCAVDLEGNVYVLDSGNYKIKKFVPRGWIYLHSGSGSAGTSLGTAGTTAATCQSFTCSYTRPTSCDIDKTGNLYVVDRAEGITRLLTINYNGVPAEVADFRGTAYNDCPISVAVTPAQKLFVAFSDYEVTGWSSSSSSVDSSSSSSVDSSSSSSSSSVDSSSSSSSSSVDSSSSSSSSE